jgi:hypothetical protein
MDELLPSLHNGTTKAISLEQNQSALFKLDHYHFSSGVDKRDIRGQDTGRGDVLRATFSRANAESIVWHRINLSDLPRLADKFWQHPNLGDYPGLDRRP